MRRIGLHFPGNSEEAMALASAYNPETNMAYELWADCDGDLVMAAWHDGVGLVNWFWVTKGEWDDLAAAAEAAFIVMEVD